MEFGIFHEFLTTRGGSQAEAFARSFAQIEAAERWGLDVVWLAEIHMNPTRSLLSAPLTVASAVAARTHRIKIGTASRSCRSATRCAWPKKPRRSTRSAAAG
jgi:alkanesulfonate monooxygenase SsuD/methylene tetrahydromethanopterin reductase-like flavin-dependent oxidoreductase (luciferase family)